MYAFICGPWFDLFENMVCDRYITTTFCRVLNLSVCRSTKTLCPRSDILGWSNVYSVNSARCHGIVGIATRRSYMWSKLCHFYLALVHLLCLMICCGLLKVDWYAILGRKEVHLFRSTFSQLRSHDAWNSSKCMCNSDTFLPDSVMPLGSSVMISSYNDYSDSIETLMLLILLWVM